MGFFLLLVCVYIWVVTGFCVYMLWVVVERWCSTAVVMSWVRVCPVFWAAVSQRVLVAGGVRRSMRAVFMWVPCRGRGL